MSSLQQVRVAHHHVMMMMMAHYARLASAYEAEGVLKGAEWSSDVTALKSTLGTQFVSGVASYSWSSSPSSPPTLNLVLPRCLK